MLKQCQPRADTTYISVHGGLGSTWHSPSSLIGVIALVSHSHSPSLHYLNDIGKMLRRNNHNCIPNPKPKPILVHSELSVMVLSRKSQWPGAAWRGVPWMQLSWKCSWPGSPTVTCSMLRGERSPYTVVRARPRDRTVGGREQRGRRGEGNGQGERAVCLTDWLAGWLALYCIGDGNERTSTRKKC